LLPSHLPKLRKGFPSDRLPKSHFGPMTSPMQHVFDMDDRSRLPWRFFGEAIALYTLG